jgi:hypothetical protein
LRHGRTPFARPDAFDGAVKRMLLTSEVVIGDLPVAVAIGVGL